VASAELVDDGELDNLVKDSRLGGEGRGGGGGASGRGKKEVGFGSELT